MPRMIRPCGVVKWGKGKSHSKTLDQLANGNCRSLCWQLPFALLAIAIRSTGKCRSLYRQLPFALPANAVRSAGKCRTVTLNGARDDFTQGSMETSRLKCFKNGGCISTETEPFSLWVVLFRK